MLNWLRRRRLSPAARKRLLLLSARAEEAIIETHVANLIELLAELDEEVDFDRGIELYAETMSLDETTLTTVTNRTLTRLQRSLPEETRTGRFQDVFR